MIRVAMLSYWHVHAWDYTRQAQENPNTEIVAVWDELPERGKAAAERLGVPFFESLNDVLAQKDVDAVIDDAPTNIHREVLVAAARAGKHIFTEKVVAATQADANAILSAVEKAGVKLTVSLPRLNGGYTQAISSQIASGAVGDVTLVRARLSHNGALRTADRPDGWLPPHFYSLEQCQGGALIDLGCHPMYLARLFLGALPERVSATYGYVTGREVEDNAVAILTGPKGAIGIVEAGFVNPNSPFSVEVHGTGGTLLYGTPEPKLLLGKAGERTWSEIEVPADLPSAFDQWVGHIQNDTVATENIQAALDLTKLMEAANRSVAEGRSIALTELSA
jgi:1,5-anhydro-D-fructose reductase (1,5-anhydro-D-mannitol-forming)